MNLATRLRAVCCAALALALAGCGNLLPKPELPITEYSFDAALSTPLPPPENTPPRSKPPTRTLIVGMPRPGAGYDSEFMLYTRQPAVLDHYARNVWVDTPVRMLSPLLVSVLDRSGAFRAVLQSTSSGIGDLRLDTELVRLQHEFFATPSRVRLTLRVHLIDNVTRRVIAGREFEAVVPAASEDANGGVIATHQALRQVLTQVRDFCVANADAAVPPPP